MGISVEDVLTSFKKNLVRLCDDLIEILPNDTDLLTIRIFVNSIPLVEAIENFADITIPYKEKILAKDEEYFLNMNGGMFENLESSKVSKFKDVYLSGKLTDDQKNVIWSYFTTFLKLGLKYRELTGK